MRSLPPPEALSASYRTSGSLSSSIIALFRAAIYRTCPPEQRPMPWRETRDPYRILVSEIMLQQTQVERVRGKYAEFLAVFPDVATLAPAPVADLLAVWQGLGYNRRALALKRCAEEITKRHGGTFPASIAELEALPGIGPYTARAVAAFAFGVAEPLIETNIRAVFIHHFFHERNDVHDREIMPLVAATLDRSDPRVWYYALMDYGALIKRTHPNPSRHSRHYTRQSAFEGSNRQLRSRILRAVMERKAHTASELAELAGAPADQVANNLRDMAREGFLEESGGQWELRQQ